ncbi:MAG: MFS transporter [Chloroflexota bacterium]
MSISGVFFFLTLNLQQVQGYSALQAGLANLPVSVLIILLSNLSGRFTDRVGPVPLIAVGLILTSASFVWLASLGLTTSYWTSFFPALTLFGMGLGVTIVPVTTVAMGALPNQYSGVASGVNNAASRVANMAAIAIFGAVIVAVFQSALAARTEALGLETTVRATFLLEANDLGATQPPVGLSDALTSATQDAITQAFLDSFQLVMWLSAAISLFSLIIALMVLRFQQKLPDQELDAE